MVGRASSQNTYGSIRACSGENHLALDEAANGSFSFEVIKGTNCKMELFWALGPYVDRLPHLTINHNPNNSGNLRPSTRRYSNANLLLDNEIEAAA
jgi:hypothetical protein